MSDDIVIRVAGLGKKYIIRHQRPERYTALRDVLTERAARLARRALAPFSHNGHAAARPTREEFWALKDASFEVKRGEVLGIIGRNGAGKSTLLKLLARITAPTTGRIELTGRVASLLEVGTGFHPELTGRENIYLNGAILGMTRAEIKRKFDEIVAFAEVEQFLDTPVKRYSAGMHVRLAFAVAAHLEPEILLVDEVLAVGDVEFQRKCLGKMDEVARGGRTILFVSHRMDVIQRLCKSVLVLVNGRCSEHSVPATEGVRQYLDHAFQSAERNGSSLVSLPRAISCDRSPIITKFTVTPRTGKGTSFPSGDEVRFDIELQNLVGVRQAACAITIVDRSHFRVAMFHSLYHSALAPDGAQRLDLTCTVPTLPLTPGTYSVELSVGLRDSTVLERVERAAVLDVHFSNLLGTGRIPSYDQGCIVLGAEWRVGQLDIDPRLAVR